MCEGSGGGGWRGTREHLRVGTAEELTRGSQGSPLALERTLGKAALGMPCPPCPPCSDAWNQTAPTSTASSESTGGPGRSPPRRRRLR